MEGPRVFITRRSVPMLNRCLPSTRSEEIRFSSCRSSSCARAVVAEVSTSKIPAHESTARRSLRRTGGNLALLGSLAQRALALHHSKRIVGQDENEQRADDGQTHFLETHVGTS